MQENNITIKPEYNKIYEVIKNGTSNINQISRILDVDISTLSSKLLMMELEGLIKSKTGNNYEITR